MPLADSLFLTAIGSLLGADVGESDSGRPHAVMTIAENDKKSFKIWRMDYISRQSLFDRQQRKDIIVIRFKHILSFLNQFNKMGPWDIYKSESVSFYPMSEAEKTQD